MPLKWYTAGFNLDEENFLTFREQIGPTFNGGDALRRTIVDLGLVVHNPADANVDSLVSYGVTAGVQITEGNPPEEPIPLLDYTFLGDVDLIYIQRAQGRIIQGANDAITYIQYPGDGSMFHCDTSVQRKSFPTSFGVWIQWAIHIGSASPGDFNVRWAYNYRVLAEEF